jgi:thiamine pyrophosphate-dependent acetolactate synthase large subunit-like protein
MFFKKPHEAPRVAGDPALVSRAIAMLKNAQRPLILTGTGVFWSGAWNELKDFVELSGIPFYTTPQGRGVIPDDHPLSFLGARNQAWKEADVVLVVGTRFNFIIGFGLPPRWADDVKFIQVDIATTRLAATARSISESSAMRKWFYGN